MVDTNEQKFNEYILNKKKRRFLEIVRRAAEYINEKPPEVRFWECPEATVNELAHIHPDRRLICVSERALKIMDIDDIDKTATHEVSHLLELEHNERFRRIHDNVIGGVWRPPPGVSTLISNQELYDTDIINIPKNIRTPSKIIFDFFITPELTEENQEKIEKLVVNKSQLTDYYDFYEFEFTEENDGVVFNIVCYEPINIKKEKMFYNNLIRAFCKWVIDTFKSNNYTCKLKELRYND